MPAEAIPRKHSLSSLFYKDQPGGVERNYIADFINETFRLQWRDCPLRSALAEYRLYFRNDMADALAAGYLLHKEGRDPEEAMRADYCPGFVGFLEELDIDEFRKAEDGTWQRRWWNHFAGFYEDGDRFLEYHHRHSSGYLLFRGDRRVWEMENCRFLLTGGPSLRWNTKSDYFISLGNTKGFLNGDFTWPQPDWVNPVTDEEEKAYAEEHTLAKIMARNRDGEEVE